MDKATLNTWVILFTLGLFLLPSVTAKAGGFGNTNISTVTNGNSQSPPNCGISSGCHNLLPGARGLEVNVSITAPTTINLHEPGTITVNIGPGNVSIDELGCMLMSLTAADGIGSWSQAAGVLVTAVNGTAGGPNYIESTTSLSFIYTVTPNSSGVKELTLQCRGGLSAAGVQNWYTLDNFNITVIGPTMVAVDFSIDFIGSHYECPQDSCWITVDLGGVASFVNCTHDDEPEHQLCANCTLVQAQFEGFSLGFHNVTINTTHGNETIRFKIVSDIQNSTELINNIFLYNSTSTKAGDGMILEMYLLLFSIGIGLMLISMLRETGLMTPLVSSIFLFITAFYSFDIERVAWTVTYEYIYEPIALLCGLLGLLMMGMTLWKATNKLPSEPGT